MHPVVDVLPELQLRPSPLFRQQVQFGERETDAQHVRCCALFPVSIRGGDERVVGQAFDARIGGVVALGVVFETHDVLPATSLRKVIPGAHPPDPIALVGALRGLAPWRITAKTDEQPAVCGIFSGVPVARQAEGQFPWLCPRLALVLGKNDM